MCEWSSSSDSEEHQSWEPQVSLVYFHEKKNVNRQRNEHNETQIHPPCCCVKTVNEVWKTGERRTGEIDRWDRQMRDRQVELTMWRWGRPRCKPGRLSRWHWRMPPSAGPNPGCTCWLSAWFAAWEGEQDGGGQRIYFFVHKICIQYFLQEASGLYCGATK